jgi:hypothetical protein
MPTHDFFHLRACHWSRQNLITHLLHHNVMVVNEDEKANLFFQHFDQVIGTFEQCEHCLDLHALMLPSINLSGPDHCFSLEEIWESVRNMPSDRAPTPTASQTYSTNHHGRSSKMTFGTRSTLCGA